MGGGVRILAYLQGDACTLEIDPQPCNPLKPKGGLTTGPEGLGLRA